MPYSTVDDLARYFGIADFGKREAPAGGKKSPAKKYLGGPNPLPTFS